jgi:hypothetical protein
MKPAFLPLMLLELTLISAPALHAQQRQPHPVSNRSASGKQALSIAGILRRLTKSEADIDGADAAGHRGRVVFIVNSSTKCYTAAVGKAVQIVYMSSGTRNIALSITEVVNPNVDYRIDVGGAGGVAKRRQPPAPGTSAAPQTVATLGSPPKVSAPGVSVSRGATYNRHSIPSGSNPATLTNADVIRLEKMGMSDESIVQTIGGARTVNFDLGPDGRKHLAERGVSQFVLTAMEARVVEHAGGNQPAEAAPALHTITLGESIEEVTKAFGPPQKTVDLGEQKTLYYHDMKVTFRNGKVVDVE